MSELRYLVAVGYKHIAPGAYLFDGWRAFERMCEAVADGHSVRVRIPGDIAEVRWHPNHGWQRD